MMKRLLFLLLCSAAFAQGVRYDLPPILNSRAQPIANAQITLCTGVASISGSNCTGTAQSFTDITLGTQCAGGSPVTLTNSNVCQATGDALGNAGFWLTPGAYIYCINAPSTTGKCYNLSVPVGVTTGGTATIAGALTVPQVNQVIHVDGVKYACSAAGINAAIAALPQTGNAPGGRVIVDGCPVTSNVTLSSTIVFGSATVPVVLELGPGTFVCAMTSGNCFQINGQGSALRGANKLQTDLGCSNSFVGDFVHVEPATGQNAVIDIDVGGFRIDYTGVPGTCSNSIGLNLLSVRDPSTIHDIEARNWTGTVVNVGISTNGGASLSQGINFQNDYFQSSGSTLTANSFILQANQVNVGPNVKVICSANCSTFNGIFMQATSNGDGHNNVVFNSSVGTNYTNGIQITSNSTCTVGASGNSIYGNTFEGPAYGVLLTGFSSSCKASANFIYANFYDPTTSGIVKLDQASANLVMERTNGNAADMLFTANSNGNRFIGMLANGNTNNFSDAGSGNIIDDGYASGGALTERDIWGEVNFIRAITATPLWKLNDGGQLQSLASGGPGGSPSFNMTEANCPSGATYGPATNKDILCFDPTLHGPLMNNNNSTFNPVGSRAVLTADWTCGTGGTVASCVAATIIGSGGGVPWTFNLPLLANSLQLDCDGVVGQATAATANQWNLLTATNGATNVTAIYDMYTAATAKAGGAVTDQASTTTTFQISPSWTLGATGTKMPFHIHAAIEAASASGTVLSVQLLAPTVGDLVTIFRGSGCWVHP